MRKRVNVAGIAAGSTRSCRSLAIGLAILAGFFLPACSVPSPPEAAKPEDVFFWQRIYPDTLFQWEAYLRALRQAAGGRGLKTGIPEFAAGWQQKGPLNTGGRINTVAIHPLDEGIMLAGLARGGIFRTVDSGLTWSPVFDDKLFLSIGTLAFAPSDPNIVYAGTGDPNISAYPGIGDGIYRSDDGGLSWRKLSCCGIGVIAKIVVHPQDPERVFVASMGLPFQPGRERGLYQSDDGGRSWRQSLFVSPQAGIIDLVIDPLNADILYAASWDRIRNNRQSVTSGPGARIFKSTNGGRTWQHLQKGLPDDRQGRIGLAIAASRPATLYAVYIGETNELFNVYRTDDGGAHWQQLLRPGVTQGLSGRVMEGFGWYFGKIRVNPRDAKDVFLLAVDLWRSVDGGQNWRKAAPPWWLGQVHPDKHDLQFAPSGAMLLATDGGLYLSRDDAANWEDAEDIPATQFYRVAVSPHQPDAYFGGTQDNGTLVGSGAGDDWLRLYDADGFTPAFDPVDPAVIYIETQYGGIKVSTDFGQSWQDGTAGISRAERRNWDAPYFLSRHQPHVLYTGTFRVYKSASGQPIPSWDPISDDLTKGNIHGANFHNISALEESPLQAGLLYAGTSDGNVWRSSDDGQSWSLISRELPDRYVTAIVASATETGRVFVTYSGYRDNEFIPRVHRSEDQGTTWVDIAGNLPDLAVNDLIVLPGRADSVIFAATDGGVYGTLDGGFRWGRVGQDMPLLPVFDISLNTERRELVAGTYARSLWTFPIAAIDGEVVTANDRQPAAAEKKLRIFPQPAQTYLLVETQANAGTQNSWVIYDLNGRKIKEGHDHSATQKALLRIGLEDLATGTYLLRVISSDNRSETILFLKM